MALLEQVAVHWPYQKTSSQSMLTWRSWHDEGSLTTTHHFNALTLHMLESI